MNTNIDQWIKRVQTRRRRLRALGGTLAAAAITGLVLLFATALEWQLFLSDTMRWSLALAIWTSGVTAGWLGGWSAWMRPLDARTIAAVADRVAPELKGDLLAAWELQHGEAAQNEATGFSILMQQRLNTAVSERTAQVDGARLLPWNLVRGNILQAFAVALLIGALIAGFGDDFLVRALRVGAPFLGYERVSRVTIRVLEPSGKVRAVAKRSQFELLVAVHGVIDRPPSVHLDGMQPVLMQSSGDGTFSAKLISGEGDMAFHVRAGDGMTPRMVLPVRDRPALRQFTKRYTLPAYLESPPVEEESDHGNLSALEGSTARVTGRFTEPVSEVSVVFVPDEGAGSGREHPLPTESVGEDGTVSFPVPMNQSGTYRIRAISRAWGVESDPVLTHEVRALPDTPPAVNVEIPESNLTVSAGSSVHLKGTIFEDYRLKRCTQQTKWNAERWKDEDLGVGNGREVAVSRTWSVPEQVPPAGGMLLTRLVAIDAKGNRTESRIVQIRVLPREVLPSESASLAAQKKLQAALDGFDEVAKQIAEITGSLRHLMEQREPDPARRNHAVEAVSKKMEQAKATAAEVAQAVESGLKRPVSKSAAEDIATVAEAFNRSFTEGILPLEQSLEKAAAAIQEGNRDAALEASRLMASEGARAASKSQIAKEAIRDFVAVREATQLLPMAKALAALRPASRATAQRASAEDASPGKKAESAQQPTAERESPLPEAEQALNVADAAAKALQDGLGTLADDSRGTTRDQVRQLKSEIEKQRTALAKGITTGDVFSEKNKAAEGLDRSLDKAAAGLGTVLPQLEKMADHAREQLTRSNASSAVGLETAAADLREIQGMKAISPAGKQQMSASRLEAQAQGLDASAALDARKQNGDPESAALRLEAARALRAVGDRNLEPSNTAEAVQSLARDLAKKEAAQRLATLKKEFEEVSREFAFSPKDGPAESSTVEQAQKLQSKAAAAAEYLRAAGLNEAASALQSPSVQTAAQEAKKAADTVSESEKQALAVKLDAAANELAAAAAKAAAKAAEASDRIASLAPKLPEALAETAQAAAQAAAANRSRKSNADRPELLAADREQNRIRARAESLRQALQADADRKGVRSAEERAAARDAEDVSALIGETARAARGVERAKAASDAAARAEGLESAATEQDALSNRLQKAADLLAASQSGDPETVAKARKALRAAESLAGLAETQSAMEARKEQIAQAARAVETAKRAHDEMAAGLGSPADPDTNNTPPPTAAKTTSSPTPSVSLPAPQPITAAGESDSRGPNQSTQMSAAEWVSKAMESLAGSSERSGDAAVTKTGEPAPAGAETASSSPAPTPASITGARKAELAVEAAMDTQRREARMNAPAGSAQAPAGAVPGQTPAGNSTSESSSTAGQPPESVGADAEGLDGVKSQDGKTWGRLPAQMAKDLTEGKKESPPAEYQGQVEAYFKAIAERSARRKAP